MTRRGIVLVVALLASLAVPAAADAFGPIAPSGLQQLPDPDDCLANGAPAGDPGCAPAPGLMSPTQGVVSPDGANVYVGSAFLTSGNVQTGTVAEFRRSTAPGPNRGALTPLPAPDACLSRDSDNGGPSAPDDPACTSITTPGDPSKSVGQVLSLAMSPDGKNLYAATGTGTLLIFNRDTAPGPASGRLTYAGCASASIFNGCTIAASGFSGARDVTVSADGKTVYVVGQGPPAGSVVALSRDPGTGQLTQLACIVEGAPPAGCVSAAHGMSTPSSVAVSSDDRTVYVGDSSAGSVMAFDRTLTAGSNFGKLTQITPGAGGCVSETGADTCVDGRGLKTASDVATSPDAKNVYVAATGAGGQQGTVAVLARATTGTVGALSQVPTTLACASNDPDGFGGNPPLDPECRSARELAGVNGVAVSGDGLSLYVSASSAFAVDAFDRGETDGSLFQNGGNGAGGCLQRASQNTGWCVSGQGLANPQAVWLSPDGLNVYASAFSGRSVVEVQRSRRPSCADASASASDPVTVPLTCTDENGDPLTRVVFVGPDHGTVGPVDDAAGTVVYTPAPGYSGPDAFKFVGFDGRNESNVATVTLDVTAAPPPPAPPPGGSPPPTPTPIPTRPRITLTRLSLLRPKFSLRQKTAFRFTLSAPASVRILVEAVSGGRRVKGRCVKPTRRNRRAKKCTRYRAMGTLKSAGLAGADSVGFSGRLGKLVLKPGRYRATLVAQPSTGQASLPRSLLFTFLRARRT
jgi:sugar lactone lactonase YvrE